MPQNTVSVDCHPGKTNKGRFFNHSRRDNDIQMIVKGDMDRIVILMEPSKYIKAGSELCGNTADIQRRDHTESHR